MIVIDESTWNELLSKIDAMQKMFELKTKTFTAPKANANEKNITEIKSYVPLVEACKLLGISKQKWYRTYQYIIQYKSYYNNTWVYLPSILKFLKQNNINE